MGTEWYEKSRNAGAAGLGILRRASAKSIKHTSLQFSQYHNV